MELYLVDGVELVIRIDLFCGIRMKFSLEYRIMFEECIRRLLVSSLSYRSLTGSVSLFW